MYCQYCGKKLNENEVCTCRISWSDTADEATWPDQEYSDLQKHQVVEETKANPVTYKCSKKKRIVIVFAIAASIGILIAAVNIHKQVEKQKAMEEIERSLVSDLNALNDDIDSVGEPVVRFENSTIDVDAIFEDVSEVYNYNDGEFDSDTETTGTPDLGGEFDGKTYINQYAGIKYVLPDGFSHMESADEDSIISAGKTFASEHEDEYISFTVINYSILGTSFDKEAALQSGIASSVALSEKKLNEYIESNSTYKNWYEVKTVYDDLVIAGDEYTVSHTTLDFKDSDTSVIGYSQFVCYKDDYVVMILVASGSEDENLRLIKSIEEYK